MDLNVQLLPGLTLPESTKPPVNVSIARQKNPTLCSLYPDGDLHLTTLPYGSLCSTHTHLDGFYTQFLWEDTNGKEDVLANEPRLLTLSQANEIAIHVPHVVDGSLSLTTVFQCDEGTLRKLWADHHVCVSSVLSVRLLSLHGDCILLLLSSSVLLNLHFNGEDQNLQLLSCICLDLDPETTERICDVCLSSGMLFLLDSSRFVYVYDTSDGSNALTMELPVTPEPDPLSSICVSHDLSLFIISTATSWALPVRLYENVRQNTEHILHTGHSDPASSLLISSEEHKLSKRDENNGTDGNFFQTDRSWNRIISSHYNKAKYFSGSSECIRTLHLRPRIIPLKIPLAGTPIGDGWVRIVSERFEEPLRLHIWSISPFSCVFCLFEKTGSLTIVRWDMKSHGISYFPLGKAQFVKSSQEDACLVISDQGLSLVLFGASQDDFLTRLMIHGSASTADTLCHLNNWGRCSVPIHALEAGLDNRQLDTVDFFLKSKISILNPLISSESPSDIHSEQYLHNVQDLIPALDLLYSYIRGTDQEAQSKHFSEQLLQLTFGFLNGQIQMLCGLLSEPDQALEQVVGILMGYITKLRPFMKKFVEQPQLVQVSHVDGQAHSWRNLSLEQIISDAILTKRIPEAQAFLRAEGHQVSSLKWMKREGLILAYKCLLEECLQEACQLLRNIGFSVLSELKRICLHTSDRAVRTLLVEVLQRESCFSEQEQEEIKTVCQVEELYSAENKRIKERHNVPPHSLFQIFFNGSREISILKNCLAGGKDESEMMHLYWAQGWDLDIKEAIILPLKEYKDWCFLNPNILWRHLTSWNAWVQISSWVESLGQERGTSTTNHWPLLTPEIVDSCTLCCEYTKQKVLDKLARMEIYVPSEVQDFEALVERMAVCRQLMPFATMPSRNAVESQEHHIRFILLCAEQSLHYLLYTYLDYHRLNPQMCSALATTALHESMPWFGFIVHVRGVKDNPEDPSLVFYASLSNAHMMMPGSQPSVSSMLLEGHTLLALATNMYSPGGIDRVLEQHEESDPCHRNVDPQLLKMALAPYPKLKAALFGIHPGTAGPPPDISLYHLLQALSPFHPMRFFTWQSANTLAAADSNAALPHCSSPDFVSKLSAGEQLDVCFFLRNGRPSFAFATFLVLQLLRCNTPDQLIKQVAEDVYSLALSSFHLTSVVASCVCFFELLGINSYKLRVDVNAANMILSHITSHEDFAGQKSNTEALARRLSRLAENEGEAASDLSGSLETAVFAGEWHNSSSLSPVSCSTIQQFCLLHSIPMSSRYLMKCAERQDWLQLLVHMHTQNKISCVIDNLSPAIKNHMVLALQDKNSNVPVFECSLDKTVPVTTSLYHLLLACQKTGNPGRALLNQCIEHRAPPLSVLAACMQDADRISCLCVWVATSVDPVTGEEVMRILSVAADREWDLQDLTRIWETLLERQDSRTLHKAFSIFLEDCPLLLLLDTYELCLQLKYYLEAGTKIEEFQKWLDNDKVIDSMSSPLIPTSWLLDRASQLLQLLLLQTQTPYELHKVLQLLSDKATPQLFGGMDVCKLCDLTSILQDQHITISKELMKNYSPEGLRVECQRLIKTLLHMGHFTLAQRVAELAELPTDTMVIKEVLQDQYVLKEIGQWENSQSRAQYWKKCHQMFSSKQLSPEIASDFLCSQADAILASGDQSESLAEQELLFTLAGHWLSLCDCPSQAALQELEQKIWKCRIKRELTNKYGTARQLCTVPSFMSVTQEFCFSSLPLLNSSMLLQISSLPPLSTTCSLLDSEYSQTLSSLIDCLLEDSKVHEASRVCRYFQLPHRDLWLLLNCRALATGEITVDQLHPEIQAILEEGREHQETLKIQRKRLQSSSSMELASSLPKDPILLDLEILKDKCAHGKTYCQQLLCVYELSQDLGCPFLDIYSQDASKILHSLLSCHRTELIERAQAVISCHRLSPQTVAQIVAEEGLKCWKELDKQKGQPEVYNTSEMRKHFLHLAKLCQDPTLVGLNLLDHLQNVPLTEPQCIVELLISAHDCFSLTCYLEGIWRVLQACRHLTEIHLAANQEYSLMVRLLSGIGRYNEMVYVFDILHKNQHFEVLLRKQLDTKGGLQTALLEYIKRCHPGDSEKHNMTALCFSLHRDIGHNHEHAALIQLKLIQSRPWEYWMNDLVELRSALMKTLTLLIDAAESYSKDSCVRQSLRCARLTRLLTLQLHLLNNGHQTKLISLDRESLMSPILALPRFYQAVIVTEAYDIQPDWAEVLYNKVILDGDFQYLEEFKQREPLRSGVFEQMSAKCKLQPPGPTGLQNLKRVLSYCEDTFTRYKLAFENQFYDVTDVLMRDSQTRCCLTDMLSR